LAQKKKQLDALKAAVASTPDFEARYAELNRSYASAKKSYDQLSDDRNQAEYQLGLEKTAVASRFEVTRPPRLEAQSAAKGILKRLVMFAVVGLVLSFGFAAFQQLRRIWRRS
jgi:uncharacterized protein involved in exopolysaccharide biosynthesis